MASDVREHLTARQEKAVAALITSKTVEEAAAKAGVSPRTLYRWQHEDPLFQAEWRSRRRAALDTAIASLQSGCIEAVEVLRGALGERNVHARIRAALGLLEHGLAANAQFELDQRLRALEEQTAEERAAW